MSEIEQRDQKQPLGLQPPLPRSSHDRCVNRFRYSQREMPVSLRKMEVLVEVDDVWSERTQDTFVRGYIALLRCFGAQRARDQLQRGLAASTVDAHFAPLAR